MEINTVKNRITSASKMIFRYFWKAQGTLSVGLCLLLVATICLYLAAVKEGRASCFQPISLQQPVIYANACSIHKHLESGKKYAPFRTLSCAEKVAQDGHIIQLQNGLYREKNLLIDKQLTIRASGGLVRIGGEYDWDSRDISIKLAPNKAANARVYFPKDPGQKAPAQVACGGPFPTVLYAHGFRDKTDTVPCGWLNQNIKDALTETQFEDYKQAGGLLKRLAKAGMIVIAFDWHKYWSFKYEIVDSKEKGIADIVWKIISQIKIEIDRSETLPSNKKWWLAEKINLRRLGLIGHSTGGGGMLEATARSRGMIKAIALIAPVCPNHKEWQPPDGFSGSPQAPCFRDGTVPQNVPMLVIHGTNDHQCQVGAFPKIVYCEANGPKHLVIIAGANHFGYTDSICLESNPDEPAGCKQLSIPNESAYHDSDGWDNPSTVGGFAEQEAQILQQRTAGYYLKAFFVHYFQIETGTGHINYLVQKSGSCNCNDAEYLNGADPRTEFADLKALNVGINVCSEQ